MQDSDNSADHRSVVSTRTMEIVVAILFLAAGAVVISDSIRIGAGWVDPDGPQAGYFPMRIGVVMSLASIVTLIRAVLSRGSHKSFVDRGSLKQVLLVLLPAAVFVGVINYTGIYVASAIYIAAFMIYMGRYSWLRSVIVGIAVSIALFFMFEVWFLVPLPKGPLEALFGY